ncbi:MAG: tetratricopeptide repeat protein [Rhodospirillaceae bacterium]|nr:tetratricopeptide repeat protein [Rhodospirillaceae bacterium]
MQNLDPQIPLTLNIARSHQVAGDLKTAIASYEKVLKQLPRDANVLQLTGTAYLQAGDFSKAEQLLEKSLRFNPGGADAWCNLGLVYTQLKKRRKALRAFSEAIRIAPNMADAYYNKARLLFDDKQYEAAIGLYEQAIKLNPGDPQALVNLGNCYHYIGGLEEKRWRPAIEAFERAIRHAPNTAEAFANIGSIFLDREWFYASAAMYSKALKIAPNLGNYRFKRSLAYLRLGLLAEGWENYEYRAVAEKESIHRRAVPPPYWDGEDLQGKSVLVWPEQGLGDQILMASMIPDLVARAGKVYFESGLRNLTVFARSFPEAVVFDQGRDGTTVRAKEKCDYQVALGGLGRFFRRDMASFPRSHGFLKADPDKVEKRRAKYRAMAGDRKLVGISWRSKNESIGAAKSSDLASWAPILKASGAWFVNLQYGDVQDDLAAAKAQLGVDVYNDPDVDSSGDLDDFFAQVAALDLVISTSNTTVHTAGSLNVPCWLLLPKGGGALWYWFLRRTDSPWYPSLYIYRQTEERIDGVGWWHGAVTRAGADLAAWIESGEPLSSFRARLTHG